MLASLRGKQNDSVNTERTSGTIFSISCACLRDRKAYETLAVPKMSALNGVQLTGLTFGKTALQLFGNLPRPSVHVATSSRIHYTQNFAVWRPLQTAYHTQYVKYVGTEWCQWATYSVPGLSFGKTGDHFFRICPAHLHKPVCCLSSSLYSFPSAFLDSKLSRTWLRSFL